jgi:hypothetical protein
MEQYVNEFYENLTNLQSNNKVLIEFIEKSDIGKINNLIGLIQFLEKRKSNKDFPNYIDGLVYSIIYNNDYNLLKDKFPNGINTYSQDTNLDYSDLEQLLIEKKFQEADQLTQRKLIQLAGLENRQWLYFTDIGKIPKKDLQVIDKLWRIYSLEKFGFSIQRNIWLKLDKDWDAFLAKIGWTLKKKTPCRYPVEFIWNTKGPKGHLPLFNQLRGSQTLFALFQHSAWEEI